MMEVAFGKDSVWIEACSWGGTFCWAKYHDVKKSIILGQKQMLGKAL